MLSLWSWLHRFKRSGNFHNNGTRHDVIPVNKSWLDSFFYFFNKQWGSEYLTSKYQIHPNTGQVAVQLKFWFLWSFSVLSLVVALIIRGVLGNPIWYSWLVYYASLRKIKQNFACNKWQVKLAIKSTWPDKNK